MDFTYWSYLIPKEEPLPPTGLFNSKQTYNKQFYTFDIETTRVPGTETSFMYIWQMADSWGNWTTGRTWEEFIEQLDRLRIPGITQVIYVHNLSFEWTFLSSYIKFTDELFIDAWRPIQMFSDGFCWRDSAVLFNNSLEGATKGCEHAKAKGDLDYSVYRDSNTTLSEQEFGYCMNDVCGLIEAILKRMKEFGLNGVEDTVATIPLTSTGYVRREVQDAKPKTKNANHSNKEVLPYLQSAFRGGNTHANRRYTGMLLRNVASYDRSSSYPDILCNAKFPTGKWVHESNFPAMTRPLDPAYAYLLHIELDNVRVKDSVTVPYIPSSSLKNAVGLYANDNGRPLFIEHAEMWITDVDWSIILDQYLGDIKITEGFRSKYGYLPDWYRAVVCKYYHGKTALKGVEGAEVEYSKSKNLLNSLYGMAVTSPERYDLTFDYEKGEFIPSEEARNARQKLPYEWGVWCTAWARERLQQGIDHAGEAFVYCDTDSVKVLKDLLPDGFETWLNVFNAKCKEDDMKSGAHATTPKGVEKYMGVFEYEETYAEFVTLGAKKYLVREEDGSLHLTLSGVPKNCVDQLGDDMTKFRDDFVFKECKLRPVRDMSNTRHEYKGVVYYNGTTLVPSDYEISTESDYRKVFENVQHN